MEWRISPMETIGRRSPSMVWICKSPVYLWLSVRYADEEVIWFDALELRYQTEDVVWVLPMRPKDEKADSKQIVSR